MTRRRSLWPREHGAYAQLLAPLLTALLLAPPTSVAALLAFAAGCAFLANEPLLVLLGHRGARVRTSDGTRARNRLIALVVGAIASGGVALYLAPRDVWHVAGVVAIPVVVTVACAWWRVERTLAGELVAAITLSGASAPVFVASGGSVRHALLLWGAWAIGFASTVIAVHRVIARNRTPASWRDFAAALVLVAALVGSSVAALREESLFAAIPLAFVSTALVVRPPPARYLRTIGVVLAVASVISGAAVVAS